MDDSEKDFGELKETLKGNTSVMIAEVSSAPAKVIKNFRKKSERPILKGAMIEEDIYIGDDQLETLFAIKSKEEYTPKLFSDEPIQDTIDNSELEEDKFEEELFDQDPKEDEDFEIPAFLRKQKH